MPESGYQLLPVGIAQAHLFRSFADFGGDEHLLLLQAHPVGWHAEVAVTGRMATGGTNTSPTFRLGFAAPN